MNPFQGAATQSETQRYFDLISGRRRGVAAALQREALRAASWFYGPAAWLRNRLYDHGWKMIEAAPVAVISVGNLTLGGTGKTPCAEYIARYLSDRGHRVTILSRGYGQGDGPNDEALVLEENLPDVPHLQGVDRAVLARLAVEELESEILVLDDGFQHRRLARNLDLVLIDATNPWGYGYHFPRGLLREAPGELRRAHAVIVTRCDLATAEALGAIRAEVHRLAPSLPVFESIHSPECLVSSTGAQASVSEARDREIAAFCGLGNPEAFRATLTRLLSGGRQPPDARDIRGLTPTAQKTSPSAHALWRTFPDHHPYSRADVESLEEWASALPPDGFVLTTQKDLVKLGVAQLAGRPLWALRIKLVIREREDQLRELLDRAVS